MSSENADTADARLDPNRAPFGPVWAQARTVALPEAPPGGPRHLLYARFEDAAALSRSYDDTRGLRAALLLNAADCSVGDPVEIVVALDAGAVRLWCGRGTVTARRVRRNRSGDDLDVMPLEDELAAWVRLGDITLGVAPVRFDRTAERVPARLKATVRVAGEPEHRVTTLDLGPGGAGFEDDARIDLGVPVEVDLRTGLFGPSVVVRGVVCWTAPHRAFGVRFLFDGPRQREDVAALVARYG